MKVLITTNGEEAAVHAIRTAVRLLSLTTSEVTVVSVIDPEVRIGGNENIDVDIEQAEVLLAPHGIRPRMVKRRGKFAEEIVAEAQEWQADLIVVGSSHRGMLSRLLASSVSDEVIHLWKGAVLLVGPE